MPIELEAVAGCSIFDERVPTPFVYVDYDVMSANIDRMATLAARANVGLRPHTKTHKIAEIARLQLEAGAVGLTVAKLDEAAALIGAGVEASYMIAQPFVGPGKLKRSSSWGALRDPRLPRRHRGCHAARSRGCRGRHRSRRGPDSRRE